MSRFVSGGTISEDPSASTEPVVNPSKSPSEREEAWIQAQAAIDATKHQQKSSSGAGGAGSGLQEGGKSLYETLQANKAAKQDAFEASTKLSNQFRSLDADEIAFLDEVSASTGARETELQREQARELELFRQRREAVEKSSTVSSSTAITGEADGDDDEDAGSWAVMGAGGRKRKKGREKGVVGGVKVRRKSSTTNTTTTTATTAEEGIEGGGLKGKNAAMEGEMGSSVAEKTGRDSLSSIKGAEGKVRDVAASASPPPAVKMNSHSPSPPPPPGGGLGLGLAAYSSDEDD